MRFVEEIVVDEFLPTFRSMLAEALELHEGGVVDQTREVLLPVELESPREALRARDLECRHRLVGPTRDLRRQRVGPLERGRVGAEGGLHAPGRVEAARPLRPVVGQKNLVTPVAQRDFDHFFQCTGCEQVYWKGSHYERMQQFVADLLDD